MVEQLAASAIVKLVYESAIKAGAGELTKTAINKGKELLNAIKAKFAGNPMLEDSIKKVEEEASTENLDNLASTLDFVMKQDSQFAEQIQNIAQQINNEINSTFQDSYNINSTASDEANVLNNQATEIRGQRNDLSRGKTVKKSQ